MSTEQPGTSVPMSLCEQIRIAEQALTRHLDWIKSVEAKLAVIVAIDIAMLGALTSRIPATPQSWWLVGLFAVIGGGAVLVSLVFCALALFPRVKSPNLSILFFGSISAYSSAEYASRFAQLSEQDYLKDLLQQVHRNSQIASAKYGFVKWATGLLLKAIIPWLFSFYMMEII